MKHHLSFSVFLLLWLVLRTSGLSCGQYEYEYDLGNEKCCQMCRPGTEMQERCTPFADTICRPCKEGFHQPHFSTWSCKLCTICDSAKGLQKVQNCKSTIDTICVRAPTALHVTEIPMKHSSKRETALTPSVAKPPSKSTSSSPTALSTEGLPGGVKKSGYWVYIVIAATLLLVSGGIILLKMFRKTRKYEEPGRFAEQMQKDRKNSFCIPIQEEHIDAKSTHVQN